MNGTVFMTISLCERISVSKADVCHAWAGESPFRMFVGGVYLKKKKATDLCKLFLYPATLLKFFLSFRSSLVKILGFLMHRTTSSVTRDSFTFSFSICICLISFSSLLLQLVF